MSSGAEEADDTEVVPPSDRVARFAWLPSWSVTSNVAFCASNWPSSALFIDNLADDKDYIQQAGARISGPGLATATGRNIRVSATVKF